MLLASCKQCNQFTFIDCPNSGPDAGRAPCADPLCGHRNPDAAFDTGQPGCNCCTDPAHNYPGAHAVAANACPGGHDPCGQDCAFAQNEEAQGRERTCPGHCGVGIPGCTVCRPLLLTIVPASGVTMRPVSGG